VVMCRPRNWLQFDFWTQGAETVSSFHRLREGYSLHVAMFGDTEMLSQIIDASDPHEAKKLGRKVRNFDADIWSAQCFEIVVKGNVEKFRQNSEMREFLLSTGNAILVEAAPRDQIWGIGLGEHNERARDPAQWRGRNLLGFALTEVRTRPRL
jgi:ribA/ribD-fused uncharacterized protein